MLGASRSPEPTRCGTSGKSVQWRVAGRGYREDTVPDPLTPPDVVILVIPLAIGLAVLKAVTRSPRE
jgi:hypothetical protein